MALAAQPPGVGRTVTIGHAQATFLYPSYEPYGELTRLYTSVGGKGVSLTGTGLCAAYGNMYGTAFGAAGSTGWMDVKGSAFDDMDREITSFRWPMNCGGSPCTSVANASKVYDGTAATLGLMTSSTNCSTEPVLRWVLLPNDQELLRAGRACDDGNKYRKHWRGFNYL